MNGAITYQNKDTKHELGVLYKIWLGMRDSPGWPSAKCAGYNHPFAHTTGLRVRGLPLANPFESTQAN